MTQARMLYKDQGAQYWEDDRARLEAKGPKTILSMEEIATRAEARHARVEGARERFADAIEVDVDDSDSEGGGPEEERTVFSAAGPLLPTACQPTPASRRTDEST